MHAIDQKDRVDEVFWVGIDDGGCCRSELFGIGPDRVSRLMKVLVIDPPTDLSADAADLLRTRFGAVGD